MSTHIQDPKDRSRIQRKFSLEKLVQVSFCVNADLIIWYDDFDKFIHLTQQTIFLISENVGWSVLKNNKNWLILRPPNHFMTHASTNPWQLRTRFAQRHNVETFIVSAACWINIEISYVYIDDSIEVHDALKRHHDGNNFSPNVLKFSFLLFK